MAGVGFELQKLVRKGTLVSTIKAFLYGAILAAGPLILTVITVGIIGWMSYGLFDHGNTRIFTETLVYTFAFSLILTGPTQIIFTRFVADKHFSKEFDHIFPAFISSMALVGILALSVAVPFYIFLEIYVNVGSVVWYKIFAILTFLVISLIWQVMGFISTTKEYQKVVWGYLGGTIISILFAYLLIPKVTITGGLIGFCCGQWLILLLLIRITTNKLNRKQYWRKEYFQYFKKYPTIALTGLMYNIGLWIDKFLFWAHFKQHHTSSLFYTYNFYDVPNFLAFLTIIPALAYFLILTETNFFKDYSRFVDTVLTQPLIIIDRRKRSMIDTLKEGMRGMMKLQGIITLLLIVFAEPLLVLLGYRGVSVWLFRILLIGVFFHVVNLNVNIIFLYYELRKHALLFTCIFAFANGIFSQISILLGTKYYGFGFLIATAGTFAISWPVLLRLVKKIDYRIFSMQPVDAVVKPEAQPLWKRLFGRVKRLSNHGTNGKTLQPEYFS